MLVGAEYLSEAKARTLADEPPQPIILDLYEALKRSLAAGS